MKVDTKYLYELLPAHYRVIDEENGKPLESFVKLLAREGGNVEDSITQLYENWFIETCDEWVVPYIGDLLGVKGVHEIEDASVYSRRAYIANTLAYRRRKGTVLVLEQLALDISGWRSKVVEFFQLLSTTQNLNHIRLHNTVTPDLRQMNNLDLINTAFDKQSHTIDVRNIETQGGLYNIMNIGIFLWRLESYPMKYCDARLIPSGLGIPDAAYTFSQLGLNTNLFNNPQTEKDIVHLAEEINVQGLLRRRNLHDELEDARQAIVNGETPEYVYFDQEYPPVFQLYVNGSNIPVPIEEITICNLSTWRLPPQIKNYNRYEADGTITIIPRAIIAAVDPVLGRITFSDPASVLELAVNYSYGFSGDVGGGPYDRKFSLSELEELEFDWHVGLSKSHLPVQGETIHTELQNAIDDWNNPVNVKEVGLITIMDNRTYIKDILDTWNIQIREGQRLFIIAADWPIKDDPNNLPLKHRPVGSFNPEDLRPHLLGNIDIEGTTPLGSASSGSFEMNGLLVEGRVKVLNGNLNSCGIDHCTLAPFDPATMPLVFDDGFEAEEQNGILNVELNRSICSHIIIDSEDASLAIKESIIDHKEDQSITHIRGQLIVQNSTIYGIVEAKSLDASNTLFMDLLDISRRQFGCVRFSYVKPGSRTPRRYRCQPELEVQTQIKELEKTGPISNARKQEVKDQILNWLFPVFNESTYGHHAYAQLGNATPKQITTGGDNSSEMGVFNYLQQPMREANLNIVLEEYLPLGLEAGIIYTT